MFVDITNPKSPLAVENILTPYKKGCLAPDKKSRLPKEHITPDVCMQILKSTNNPVNIKHMLECIAELPPSEQALFKNVVLATFDRREQPEQIQKIADELANDAHYVRELDKVRQIKTCSFWLSAPQPRKAMLFTSLPCVDDCDLSGYEKVIFLSHEKIVFKGKCRFPKVLDFPEACFVALDYQNLRNVRDIKLRQGVELSLVKTSHLPENLDLSVCDKIFVADRDVSRLNGCKYNPCALTYVNLGGLIGDWDFTSFGRVKLNRSSLGAVKSVKFRTGAVVDLCGVYDIASEIDCSSCAEVYLDECQDSHWFQLVKMPRNGKITLSRTSCLPKVLDVSVCREADFSYCDFENVQDIRLSDGAVVDFSHARHLPSKLDVSCCADVNFSFCSLNRMPLVFRAGAWLDFTHASHFPEKLDFSSCERVVLAHANLATVKKIVFKNRKQMEESQFLEAGARDVKVVFAEDNFRYRRGKTENKYSETWWEKIKTKLRDR